jgi:hypothetical protein
MARTTRYFLGLTLIFLTVFLPPDYFAGLVAGIGVAIAVRPACESVAEILREIAP